MGDYSAPVAPVAPDAPVRSGGSSETGATVLDAVRSWLERYISVVHDNDLDVLALWALHTHLAHECYTTPRLLLDSPVPESGKTTTLEHLQRLCFEPVQMASISSPAMLARLLDAGPRTLLIDEVDRSLAPDKPGVGDLIAVLNSGYKRGATRPTLVPDKESSWAAKELPTFAPVAMAGNSPRLPDDTQSRCIRVLLMPDPDDVIEDSDWELIEGDARYLGQAIAAWADEVRDQIKTERPPMPDRIRGRNAERWRPLKRVAVAAGGHWPELVDQLALDDLEDQELAKEEGIVTHKPHVALLHHLAEVWNSEAFVSTEMLIDELVRAHPETWGETSSFGKRLTPQRLGRMLSNNYKIRTTRPERTGPRGYTFASLNTAWRRFGITPPNKPAQVAQPAQPALLLTQKKACKQCNQVPNDSGGLGNTGYCLECETSHPSIPNRGVRL